jgi:hypothetical protein
MEIFYSSIIRKKIHYFKIKSLGLESFYDMNKFLFLLFSVLTLQVALANDGELKSAIKSFTSSETKPDIDYSSNCSTCASKEIKVFPKASLYSKSNDTKISLSVLTLVEANALFNELASNPEIPFEYPLDGCYARAHKMSMIMEKKGITSGKAWVTGDLFVDTSMGPVEWGYHVAPLVLVQGKKGAVPYVFDPSLSKTPIPFNKWKKKILTKKGSKLDDEYYTNRFAFTPNDRTNKYEKFNDSDIQITEQTNQSNLKLQQPKKDQTL